MTDTTGGTVGQVYFGPTGTLAQYTPSGALENGTLGNQVTESFGFNNRLQPCSESASLPPALGGVIYNRQIFYSSTAEPNWAGGPIITCRGAPFMTAPSS